MPSAMATPSPAVDFADVDYGDGPDALPAFCDEVKRIITERGAAYGRPCDNHSKTAELWSVYLGVRITPRQVCVLNILQKVSRDTFHPKRDNLLDIAGYAANASRVWEGDA